MLLLLHNSVVQFDVRYCDTSSIALLLRIILAIPELLYFQMTFRIYLDISVKDEIRILIVIAFNLYIAFDSRDIYTILILLNHEHGRSSYVLVSTLIYFFIALLFLLERSFTSIVRFYF
jgi:hypothetical protein